MHITWHIAWLCVGILIGVAVAPATEEAYTIGHWFLIVVFIVALVAIKRFRYLAIAILLCGTVVGLWRGGQAHSQLDDYAPFYGQSVQITGLVNEDTTFGPKGDQRLRIARVQINGLALPGSIWVSTVSNLPIKRGDIVELSGTLQEGFGNIPASMFRAEVNDVQRPYPGDIGRRARDWFAVGVERSVPGENAEFALAYLVGQKLTTSDALNDQLKIIGLIHVVVASGAHLTILVGAVRQFFIKVSKYLTALFSTIMIGGFILITGFSPSMTRAGIVSGLSLAAWYYGRVIHPLVLLPFAAALTVMYKPAYIWGDIGWYLSFAAFTGVIVLAPLVLHYFWGVAKRPSMLRDILVATIAAQLMTLPIAIYAFGYLSAYALLANLLVVPLVPVTMLLTFLAGIAGLIIPAAAQWIGAPLYVILEYMKWIINWLANLPAARNEVTFGIPLVILSYCGILALSIYLWRVTGHNFRRDTVVQRDF